MSFTTDEICSRVAGRLEGPGDLPIVGLERVERASQGQLTFIGNSKFATKWAISKASAALVQDKLNVSAGNGRALIRVPDPDLALAAVLEMFAPPWPKPDAASQSGAHIDPTAQLGKDIAIGAGAVIGPHVCIGDGTVVHSNVTILDDAVIGARCTIWPGAVVRERCEIGDDCILHSNVVIGADGFGYRPSADGRSLVKIPQIGIVRIGRGVEIGAGTCVDRGKFSETWIGDGTKIDNLCQIGHNCQIGRCVVIAGLAGFGGSVTVGDGAMIGGGSIIKDHVNIGARARLAGCSGVMNDVPDGATWFGFVAQDAKAGMREIAAVRKLPEFLREHSVRKESDTKHELH